MAATILSGHTLAAQILAATRARVNKLVARGGAVPTLAVVVAGQNPASTAYLDRLDALATDARIAVSRHHLGSVVATHEAESLFARLNADPAIHAILPLLPLGEIPAPRLAEWLDPLKDVDGMHPLNIGRSELGLEAHVPCTALAAVALAESVLRDLRGVVTTVVGATGSVGRPLAQLLLRRGATLTSAHVGTRDLVCACRTARLLFVAVGSAGLIDARHIAPGAVVIDIGINAIGSRLLGDVNLDAVRHTAGCISAVPDGVGPVTSACLMSNCVDAALRALEPAPP